MNSAGSGKVEPEAVLLFNDSDYRTDAEHTPPLRIR